MSIKLKTANRRAWQPLWNCLDKYFLPYSKGNALLAISGGPDSRAVLEAIACWSHRLHTNIEVVTFNHNVRKESKFEARFIKLRAKRLGFLANDYNLSPLLGSSEDSLRKARYNYLIDFAKQRKIKNIITAHHKGDNASGYLMSLFGVGGGKLGAAIEPLSYRDDIRLIRPFIELSKNQLLMALTLSGNTDFATDSLDLRGQSQRAYIRNNVLPKITPYAQDIEERLNQFACYTSEQNLVLQRKAKSLIKFKNNSAYIHFSDCADKTLYKTAIKICLASLVGNKDLRRQGKIVEGIGKYLGGLDPNAEWFTVRNLCEKTYHMPGAKMVINRQGIRIKRI